jgi:hypothetical protein
MIRNIPVIATENITSDSFMSLRSPTKHNNGGTSLRTFSLQLIIPAKAEIQV